VQAVLLLKGEVFADSRGHVTRRLFDKLGHVHGCKTASPATVAFSTRPALTKCVGPLGRPSTQRDRGKK
jgi:hypothetical protein